MDKTRNLRYLRAMNRAGILHRLATGGPSTRRELTAQLGLTKMAISTITTEMMAEGLITESDPATGAISAGRRPAVLALQPSCAMALGLYLSRDNIEGVLCDISGQSQQYWQCSLAGLQGKADYRKRMEGMLDRMLASAAASRDSKRIAGIGISCIGPLDARQGRLLAPPNFYGLEDLPLLEWVRRKTALPAFIDNDMNAAVLAEQLYGAARNQKYVVYIGLTNGVGAGIIADGRIFRGGGGYGGEFGHTSIRIDGPPCSCGQCGCLELYASIPVILQQTGVRDLPDLIQRSADPGFLDSWRNRLIEVLAPALTNLVNLFDPDMILLGHQGVRLAPLLLPDLEVAVNQCAFQKQSRHFAIRPAAFGERTPLIGAACQIFQAIFHGDLLLT